MSQPPSELPNQEPPVFHSAPPGYGNALAPSETLARKELDSATLSARRAFHKAMMRRLQVTLDDDAYLERLLASEKDDLKVLGRLKEASLYNSSRWLGGRSGVRHSPFGTAAHPAPGRLRRLFGWFWN